MDRSRLIFRSLLTAFLPAGTGWAEWRDPESARARVLEWVSRAMEFDVTKNDYWHRDWGERPADLQKAIEVAERFLVSAPPLLPIYGHRFLAAVPPESGNPVFSMYQFMDTIYYGFDLADHFHREFGAPRPAWARDEPREVPFWTSVVS